MRAKYIRRGPAFAFVVPERNRGAQTTGAYMPARLGPQVALEDGMAVPANGADIEGASPERRRARLNGQAAQFIQEEL